MNITTKIIITDTNIITDLNNANILQDFIKLDNVYITDVVKHDEINSSTGNINLISNFKVIRATEKQLLEISDIINKKKCLSVYDALNFIVARDNNAVLATGDNALKVFAENMGVEVIRTLKIIELMIGYNIISFDKGIKACELLKENSSTRIPIELIDNLICNVENKE